jgi:hypothetical protein
MAHIAIRKKFGRDACAIPAIDVAAKKLILG